ncbi:MAG TPA: TetR family transcriptional regulator [Microbacterium sp.]|nr:TetR family transcriptional regulator [Microbacterium sp.]
MSTDLLTDEACGLRERKKRETRRAINGAALDLVEEKGFGAVTTEEIAARAGVSARTFFNYFPSKETAVIGTTADELEAYAAQLEEVRDGESSIDALRRILAGMLAPASIDRGLRVRRRRILLGEPALAPALVGNNIRIENALTAALERRLGLAAGSSLEPRITVAVAIAAVRACIEHQQNGGSGRLERNIDQAFDRIAAGLR